MTGLFKQPSVQGGFRTREIAAVWTQPALRWSVFVVLGLATVGCAVQQPAPSSTPCAEQYNDIARLQRILTEKDAEIASLRTHQQGQTKELQESTAQAARAQVKLRRLATQADAASAIAQAQVAMATLQSSQSTGREDRQLIQAQRIQEVARASFQQGDYGNAIDQAAQAGQLIAMVAELHTRTGSGQRRLTKVSFQVPIPLRVMVDSNLRRQPRDTATVSTVLKANSPVEAHAYKGHWLLVKTDDGHSGWLYRLLVVAP